LFTIPAQARAIVMCQFRKSVRTSATFTAIMKRLARTSALCVLRLASFEDLVRKAYV
jgi:hypothetical protein